MKKKKLNKDNEAPTSISDHLSIHGKIAFDYYECKKDESAENKDKLKKLKKKLRLCEEAIMKEFMRCHDLVRKAHADLHKERNK